MMSNGSTAAAVQFRSAGEGTRLLIEEEEAPTIGRDSPGCSDWVEYERGELIKEQKSDPRAPFTLIESESRGLQVQTLGGPLPVTEPESDDERAVYRVLYDDERLSSVEWRLPSFNFYLPVPCPDCGGLAWGFHHTESRGTGRSPTTTSTGPPAPKRRKRPVTYIEYRCNECGSAGHGPAKKLGGGIGGGY